MVHSRTIQRVILSLLITLSFSNCSDTQTTKEEKVASVTKKENLMKTSLDVEGMTCGGCEASIEGNLLKLEGVVSVKASHVDKTTVVEYDKTKINDEEIAKEIIASGYKIISEKEKTAPKEAPAAMKCGDGRCGKAK